MIHEGETSLNTAECRPEFSFESFGVNSQVRMGRYRAVCARNILAINEIRYDNT